jgi:hypothetical protein
LGDWIYCTLHIHTVRDYRQYSAIVMLHTFQFTAPHALGFSALTSRILATNLSRSHCIFKSHMKSSFHSLIPFLPLFCYCQFRKLDFIKFLCSQALILLSWRLETRFFTSRLLTLLVYYSVASSVSFYNPSARATQKTAFIIKKACLLARYVTKDVLLLHAYATRECVYQIVA